MEEQKQVEFINYNENIAVNLLAQTTSIEEIK